MKHIKRLFLGDYDLLFRNYAIKHISFGEKLQKNDVILRRK